MKKNCKIITLAFAFLMCALGCEKVYASICSEYCKEFNTDKKKCLAAEPYVTPGADELKKKPNYSENKHYLCTCTWPMSNSLKMFGAGTTNACKGVYKDDKTYKVDAAAPAPTEEAPADTSSSNDGSDAPQGS